MLKRVFFGAITLLMVCSARAGVFGFNRITANADTDVAAQFLMDVSDVDTGLARVVFTNSGPVAATISEIYFSSNSDSHAVAINSVASSDDGVVDFTIGNVQPSSPPGVNKNFWVTLAAAQATSPSSRNGINPSEYLIMDLSYGEGLSFAQLLMDGQIQVALHVISIDGGESDTFVNNRSVTAIPEPASLILIGTTGSVIAFARRMFC